VTTLYLVIPLALLVSGAAVVAFVWSVRRGQLDDLETPALRMLEEDEPLKHVDPSSDAEPSPSNR
jgi:cbb3-type cytochrome oxidase maturation protein